MDGGRAQVVLVRSAENRERRFDRNHFTLPRVSFLLRSKIPVLCTDSNKDHHSARTPVERKAVSDEQSLPQVRTRHL